MRLTSFSPTSVYPSLYLDRYVYPVCAVYNGVHPFDHRSFQPGLCVCGSFCVALDGYSSWQTRTGVAPGHSPLRSHRRASASFRLSAADPWTGALRRSVSFSTFMRRLPVSVRVSVSPWSQARLSRSCHLFRPTQSYSTYVKGRATSDPFVQLLYRTGEGVWFLQMR